VCGELQTSLEKQSSRFEGIRNNVTDVKQLLAGAATNVALMEGKLQAQETHLKDERMRCHKLESHIAEIEHYRQMNEIRLTKGQDVLSSTMQEIVLKTETLLEHGSEHRAEQGRHSEHLSACQSMLDKIFTKTSGIGTIGEDVACLRGLFNTNAKSTVATLQAEIACLRSVLERQIENQDLTQDIGKTEFSELVEAKATIARLEQDAKHLGDVQALIQEQRNLVQEHEKTGKELLDRLIDVLRYDKISINQQSNDLTSSLQTLITQWQSATTEITSSKHEKEQKARRVATLEGQLDRVEQESESLRSKLQSVESEFETVKGAEERIKGKASHQQWNSNSITNELSWLI
jgi:chromosome segregation ATPase